MFAAHIYRQRREALRKRLDAGVVLFLGNGESPINFADNVYPFRQDSCFLYYWGIDQPGMAALIDVESGAELLFGDDFDISVRIWTGAVPKMSDWAAGAGGVEVRRADELAAVIKAARQGGRPIHILPPYRDAHRLALAKLLAMAPEQVAAAVSEPLLAVVIAQRSVKSQEEIEEIETALAVTRQMHLAAMAAGAPNRFEYEVAALLQERCYAGGGLQQAFAPILTVSGEILHNPVHHQEMQAGQLVINDSGAASKRHYASDITRTFPVSGNFTSRQAEIYSIVLGAQAAAIDMLRPDIAYRDVHRAAVEKIAAGLVDLGLMTGDPAEIVAKGAHALFMPHGLGHMLGLDVHDMENLGEDRVGYTAEAPRSSQFGLSALRLGRELMAGFVVTVEPGIYFIPALIAQWQAAGRFSDHIRYERLEPYLDFGGVRIEDDVLITDTGARVLGPPIPKQISEVEAVCG
ncbi:MAG: aminopeptidase P family protein [Desulfosarcinaceae bacterium]